MKPRWDILGIGVIAVDDLLYVDHYPEPDTKLQIQKKRREGGGLAGTALVAASRMAARTAYLGVLGEDELSRFTIDELEREGVDCSEVTLRPNARPVHSIIIVDGSTGHRTILYTYQGVENPAVDEIREDVVSSCRVLFLDHSTTESGFRALELAHRHGVPVVADIEHESWPCGEALIESVDHLIVGVELAARVTGRDEPERMVAALARPERACCVVTAGALGCWYAERDGQVQHFPAYQVDVVDTTGCGDVFHGAYAAAIARHLNVPEAIQLATATAAIKATHPGGRSGIPNLDTVRLFLQEWRPER